MTSIDSDTSQDIAEAISLKGGRYLEAQVNIFIIFCPALKLGLIKNVFTLLKGISFHKI